MELAMSLRAKIYCFSIHIRTAWGNSNVLSLSVFFLCYVLTYLKRFTPKLPQSPVTRPPSQYLCQTLVQHFHRLRQHLATAKITTSQSSPLPGKINKEFSLPSDASKGSMNNPLSSMFEAQFANILQPLKRKSPFRCARTDKLSFKSD